MTSVHRYKVDIYVGFPSAVARISRLSQICVLVTCGAGQGERQEMGHDNTDL